MPLKEEVLGQFLGDEKFPIELDVGDREAALLGLRRPALPASAQPDVRGHRRLVAVAATTCSAASARRSRRDWIAKNVNGYLYTAAIPAEAGLKVDAQEYGYATSPVVPEDPEYAAKIGTYLGAVLPTYGLEFVDWWRDRLVPEMDRNFAYLEGMLDKQDQLNLMELACLLEDAIDIHDRHWKIHWMLNFAQLSATLNLRAVMEKTHGKINEQLLGRLQNSAKDRNWDSIEALWKMKEEAKADPELAADLQGRHGRRDHRRPQGQRARPALHRRARRALPEGVRLARRLEPRVHLPDRPSSRWSPSSSSSAATSRPTTTIPKTIAALAADIDAAAKEILEGLEGEALEEMRAANEINLRMAPLTPDHHFYIDQGANAHVRLVLIAIGQKLVALGRPRRPGRRRLLPATTSCASSWATRPAWTAGRSWPRRKAAREKAYTLPAQGVGRDRHGDPARLPVPEPVGLPRQVLPARHRRSPARSTGIGASPGVVEGIARVVLREDQFDDVRAGDILVCQMTNPAWVVLFTKIVGLVTDAGGTVSHPAVLSREFGIPAVVGTSVGTEQIKNGDRIRINGTTGVVEILASGARPWPAVGIKD